MAFRLAVVLTVLGLSGTVPGFAEIVFDRFDQNHSTISFTVPIMGGLSEVTGKFTEFSITLHYDEEDLAGSSVVAEIQTASISTGIDQRDKHLQSADFFDSANHPAIRFESKRIVKRGEGWLAIGPLEMRGITKKIEISFTVAGVREDPEDHKVLIGLSATTTLNRIDYEIAWKHSAVANFVGKDIGIEIRLLSKQTGRPSPTP